MIQYGMACEKEKKWLADNFKKAPTKELEAAVEACCGKLSMEHTYKTAGLQNTDDPRCDKALHSLAASSICNKYSAGACPPCCSAVASVVGPIMHATIGKVADGIKNVWGKLFGDSGGCDFKPAGDKILAGYAKATRDLADSIRESWVEMRMVALGFDHLDESYPMVKLRWVETVWKHWEGGLYVPVEKDDPLRVDFHDMTPGDAWDKVLVHNASVLAIHEPKRTAEETADDEVWRGVNGGSWGFWTDYGTLSLPSIKSDAIPPTPEHYYYFSWEPFKCKGVKEWESYAKSAMRNRWYFIEKAAERLLNDMVLVTANELHRTKSMKWIMKIQPPSPPSTPKSNTGLVVGVIAALAVAGGLTMHFKTRP